MKCSLLPIVIVFICLLTVNFNIQAQNFHMVKDVNDSKDGSPANNGFVVNNGLSYSYAILNNVAYFSANDGIHGTELWRSDGTAAGTYMVKDINGTTSSSDPNQFVTSGKYVFFRGTDNVHGTELWRTDGTDTGTILVKDIYTLEANSAINFLTDVNGTLFFSEESVNGNELMKSDGTEAGTAVVKDITPGTSGSSVNYITNVNGKVFFIYYSSITSLAGLYESDGTDKGTVQLTNFNPGSTYSSAGAVGNRYLFRGIDNQPWISDGTVAGTHVLKKIPSNSNGSSPDNFTSMNGIAYFSATDADHGTELWRSDGTGAGTYMIKDIAIGADSSSPSSLISINNILFFLVNNSIGNTDLWRSNGTSNGTLLVKTFGTGYLAPAQYLTNVNNTLYFEGYTAGNGYEPWISDGTTNGTVLLKDIYLGIYSSSPLCFTGINNKILFSATDGSTGNELWMSDGTENNTHLLKDINQITTSDGAGYWTTTPFNGKIYFRGITPKNGTELWVTDGTAESTKRITDIQAGSLSGVNTYSLVSQFYTSSNKLYFQAGNLQYGNELWSTDGTTTNLVKDITPGRAGTSFPENYFPGNKKEYASIDSDFLFVSGSNEDQLWKANSEGALLLKSGIGISGLTINNNSIYFADNYGELWKTNGTIDGTVKINNALIASNSYSIPSLVSYKNKIYFRSTNGTMWVTDGTDAGTSLFKAIDPRFDNGSSYPNTTNVILNGILYFVANDGISGLELWKTDGTATGTTIVKDIYAGAAGAFDIDYATGFFTKVDNRFYFTAEDALHGIELWRSDGTTEGTILVKDITQQESTVISSLTQVGDKLAFLVEDNTQKEVLWQSDGTDAGTIPVNDVNLNNVTITDYFNNALVGFNDQLYFTGYTYKYGNELWTGTLSKVLAVQLINFTGKLLNNKDAQLNWTTENEQNFSYFNLQRSVDGIHFSTVSKLTAKGNVGLQTAYEYEDKNIIALEIKAVYYRLQEIDKDGKATLSNIVIIQLNHNGIYITVQPNPVISNFKVQIYNINNTQEVQVQVINAHGETILSEKRNINNGNNFLNYKTFSWPSGLYIVKITLANGLTKEIKIIKQMN